MWLVIHVGIGQTCIAIRTLIRNYIHIQVWDLITHLFLQLQQQGRLTKPQGWLFEYHNNKGCNHLYMPKSLTNCTWKGACGLCVPDFYWQKHLGYWSSMMSWCVLNSSPLNKMAALSQKIFSDAFLWMKSFAFWLIFHWSLFLRVQLTITQHCLDNGLALNRWQAVIWINADLIHWCIYAALGGDELIAVIKAMQDISPKCSHLQIKSLSHISQ